MPSHSDEAERGQGDVELSAKWRRGGNLHRRAAISEESGIACEMQEGRDLWWDDALAEFADCPCEETDAEDPLFVLYTRSTVSRRGFFTRPPLHGLRGYAQAR